MKKQLLLFVLLIALFSACKKDTFDATKQAAVDDAKIQAYIAANHVDATKSAEGYYYQVLKSDTGAHPSESAKVQVSYTGTLLNGTQFDKQAATIISLPDAIKGWQLGIPKISNGGRILLIIPSSLAYGQTASSTIPANSVLVFTIDLLGYY